MRHSTAAAALFGPAFALQYAEFWSRFARRSATGIARLLRRSGVRAGTVVDLGCGPGTLAAHLIGRGYRVVGIDRSPAMLRLARRAAPTARFRAGDLRDAPIPAADAVVSTFDSLNYVRRARDLRRVLSRVGRALRPGGVFLFDVLTPAELRTGPADDVLAYRWAGAIVVVRIERRRRAGLIRHTVTTMPRLGARPRRHREVHVQRVFAPAAVARWLRAAGLVPRRLASYPGFPGQAGRAVFLARKPG